MNLYFVFFPSSYDSVASVKNDIQYIIHIRAQREQFIKETKRKENAINLNKYKYSMAMAYAIELNWKNKINKQANKKWHRIMCGMDT